MVVREMEFCTWAGLGHMTIVEAECFGVTPIWSEWNYQRLVQTNLLCFYLFCLLKLFGFCLGKGFCIQNACKLLL